MDEAGTEVCAPKLDEKSYFSTRDQQETAESERSQVPIWLAGQLQAPSRPIRGRDRVKGQTGGIESQCWLWVDWVFTWKTRILKWEKLSKNAFLHTCTLSVSLVLIFVVNPFSILNYSFQNPFIFFFQLSCLGFKVSFYKLQQTWTWCAYFQTIGWVSQFKKILSRSLAKKKRNASFLNSCWQFSF